MANKKKKPKLKLKHTDKNRTLAESLLGALGKGTRTKSDAKGKRLIPESLSPEVFTPIRIHWQDAWGKWDTRLPTKEELARYEEEQEEKRKLLKEAEKIIELFRKVGGKGRVCFCTTGFHPKHDKRCTKVADYLDKYEKFVYG